MEELAKKCNGKRDEWEIQEDYRAVKRAISVFKDKERLEDVKNIIREKAKTKESLEAVADGDLKTALGL